MEKANQIYSYDVLLKEESDKLEAKYGNKFSGIKTNWPHIIEGLLWAKEFMNISNEVPLPEEFIDNVCKGIKPDPHDLDTLKQSYKGSSDSIEVLAKYFNNMDNYFSNDNYSNLTIDQILYNIDELNNRIEEIKIWSKYVETVKEMKNMGLSDFIDKIIELRPKKDCLRNTFYRAFYQSWAEYVCSKVPLLGEFRGSVHFNSIMEFRELDKKLSILSTAMILENLNEAMPALINIRGSEVSKIRTEGAKKARHWPLRKLFGEIPNLLPKLKPCLLMSPLSVSHYLDKQKYNFDLIIFDEASQICSEDAVGAISRGKQLIVAGDNQQLPPTRFFQSELFYEDDYIDDYSDTFDIFESVLDECESIGLTPEPLLLKWHYRSKHESLIAYSNSKFYQNQLITFPSAQDISDDLGVKFIFVPDGIYDKGGKRNNIKEAEKVADLVIEHFSKYGDKKTLGVATLNIPQRDLIMDILWLKEKERPDLAQYFQEDRLSGFFVKNLESVQGDERDVIILSLGYGKDSQGTFSMNFGPLNKEGGEKRLNVIVTRAKEKTLLVSSIKASDFALDTIKSSGVRHLYQYLDYAERGKDALALTIEGGETDSIFEDEIKNEINILGYNVISQVGCSNYRIDLGVLDPAVPGTFILGVECDGRTYHSAFTARERDRIRQDVLESLGWKIYRIWSTDWFHNRKQEIIKLKSVLQAARENIYLGGDINIPPEVGISYTPAHEENILDGTSDYVVFRPRIRYPSYEFNTIGNYLLRRTTLKSIVKEEGPIHIDLAGKRLKSVWGINRMGSIIQETISNTIHNCVREKMIFKKGDFLWNTSSFKITQIRIPKLNEDETFRDPEHVCPEEMQAALLHIIRKAVGIDHNSLITESARLFGWNRNGERVETVITKAIKKLLSMNSIIIEDNNIRIC